jgi:hypothetical protein
VRLGDREGAVEAAEELARRSRGDDDALALETLRWVYAHFGETGKLRRLETPRAP